MKYLKLLSGITLIINLLGCSTNISGNTNNLTGFTSPDNCPQLPADPTSAYWEYGKGKPIPLFEQPILQNPQARFSCAHGNLGMPPLTPP
ncbi:hypothetical protein LG651_14860 [Tamlana sp. 62-3]|uniref:Uncharacterized protein n=1 Tax=Neotamlana sargassicola TaxID=2883125 RepID=A0A9X1IA29_9FLAO|nr:hypothetical protein [Tamlana sargassicola]MCB4809534.1 hypothetical protein [Tamlana sargassicola]